jgi:uncharacterized protein (TIGR02996 family)
MTDPDADALLRTIVRKPREDTPRLVYADWLEENDRPEEAEFLRVQCRLAATDATDPAYPELLDRDEELRLWLTAHVPGPRLAFPAGLSIDGGSHWWWYARRGYPRCLEFDGTERPGARAMRALASALKRAFEAVPARHLVVTDITLAQLTALLKQPVLSALDQFTVHLTTPTDAEATEAARLLAKCRHLRNLSGLALSVPGGDEGCAALAGAHWSELDWLSLDCAGVTPDGLRALAGSDWFQNLGELTLFGGLSGETFDALTRVAPLKRLHALTVEHSRLAPEVWEAFERTKALPALAALKIEDGHLGPGAEHVAAARGFALRALELIRCGAGNPIGAALAASPWAGKLRRLALDWCGLEPRGAHALLNCRAFGALRHLSLGETAIGPSGLAALAANPALRGLRALRLGTMHRRPELAPSHFEALLTKLDLPDLRHLDLRGRRIGPRAARKLADPKFAALTRLDLRECNLSDRALAVLATAPNLSGLIELRLDNNAIGAGAEVLADRGALPRLAECTLGGNALPPAVARKLRRRAGVRT